MLSPRDEHHDEATAIMASLSQTKTRLYTTNFVVAELHALAITRVDRDFAFEVLQLLDRSRDATIVRVAVADEVRAREIIRQYNDKSFSLADATSFAVMERLDLTFAFAFDRHFAQFGFILVRADTW